MSDFLEKTPTLEVSKATPFSNHPKIPPTVLQLAQPWNRVPCHGKQEKNYDMTWT